VWQWLRCGPDGDLLTCDAIPGADGPSYLLTAADVGHAIRAGVQATNSARMARGASAATAPVRGRPVPVLPAPVVTPPAPAPSAFAARLSAIRCGGRTCRVTLALTGPVARARVDLLKGVRRLARATPRVRGATLRVTLRTRRALRRGTYTIAVRLTAPDRRTQSFHRTVRVR
jgi:hypothetical protein